MNKLVLIAGCAATLGACNKGPDVNLKNASVNEVAEKMQGAVDQGVIQAGKWESKITIDDIEFPGMPANDQAKMKRMLAGQQNMTFDACVTPEQAKHPGAEIFSGKNAGKCRFEHFTMAGGKIDAVLRCEGGGDSVMTMTRTGTYTADSYNSSVTMNVTGRGGGMSMKGHGEGHRVGQCTAEEIKAQNTNGK